MSTEFKAITEQEVTECIEGVFNEVPQLREFLIKTDHGPALRLNVNSTIGAVQILYLLPPVARFLLEKYANEPSRLLAKSLLMLIIEDLPIGIRIGLDNTFDAAELTAREMWESIGSVAKESALPFDPAALKKRRAATLKKMNDRNTVLVEEPKRGPKAKITLNRISAAVGRLKSEGIPSDQITAGMLALRLKCDDSAIYQALRRQGKSFEEFLGGLEIR
jgi:hypothetical protein